MNCDDCDAWQRELARVRAELDTLRDELQVEQGERNYLEQVVSAFQYELDRMRE